MSGGHNPRRDRPPIHAVTGGRAARVPGVDEAVRQTCRVSVDGIEFVESLAADTPKIGDERQWE